MGAARVIIGLAWRNLRRRPWQALLLLFALILSTTAITVALTLTEIGDRAWDRVSEDTNGFHVAASAEVPRDASSAQRQRVRADLAGLASAPAVVAAAGPWPPPTSSARSTAPGSASKCRSATPARPPSTNRS